MENLEVKKLSDCKGSISDFLKVGDLVDDEFVEYFLSVLPPKTWTSSIIQIGEATDHVDGKATYATLVNSSEGWRYAGNCHKGQAENKVSIWEQIEQCQKDHVSAPTIINGQQGWIIGAPWGVGVRYYPEGVGFIGAKEQTPDGLITLIEPLQGVR